MCAAAWRAGARARGCEGARALPRERESARARAHLADVILPADAGDAQRRAVALLVLGHLDHAEVAEDVAHAGALDVELTLHAVLVHVLVVVVVVLVCRDELRDVLLREAAQVGVHVPRVLRDEERICRAMRPVAVGKDGCQGSEACNARTFRAQRERLLRRRLLGALLDGLVGALLVLRVGGLRRSQTRSARGLWVSREDVRGAHSSRQRRVCRVHRWREEQAHLHDGSLLLLSVSRDAARARQGGGSAANRVSRDARRGIGKKSSHSRESGSRETSRGWDMSLARGFTGVGKKDGCSCACESREKTSRESESFFPNPR